MSCTLQFIEKRSPTTMARNAYQVHMSQMGASWGFTPSHARHADEGKLSTVAALTRAFGENSLDSQTQVLYLKYWHVYLLCHGWSSPPLTWHFINIPFLVKISRPKVCVLIDFRLVLALGCLLLIDSSIRRVSIVMCKMHFTQCGKKWRPERIICRLSIQDSVLSKAGTVDALQFCNVLVFPLFVRSLVS